jgi:UTP--glucose-1-phosphate uridylyltransferase
MSRSVVKKAVFPVAGLGTRILPATKSIPKELLPVVDKPILQYVVDEALNAGIDELVFVVSRTKNSIQDYFDKSYELEAELEKKNKTRELELVRSLLPADVDCAYVRQPEALGLGHAVLCARMVIGNEPFAVILPDDLMADSDTIKKMVGFYAETGSSIIAVEQVDKNQTDKYGVIDAKMEGNGLPRITEIVEKPSPQDAPSNLAVVGRYVFNPDIFARLERTSAGVGGEIQLTDAIASLLQEEAVYAYELEGRRFDCGTKLGYLEAIVHYALHNEELSAGFREYLHSLELN